MTEAHVAMLVASVAIALIGALAHLVLRDVKRQLAEAADARKGLQAAVERAQVLAREELRRHEERCEASDRALQAALEKSIETWRNELQQMPARYVLKDDYLRTMAAVDHKLDRLDRKIVSVMQAVGAKAVKEDV